MIDLERIKTFYRIGRNLQWRDIQALLYAAKSATYQPGEYLIKEGSCKKEVFLIKKGLVRIFHLNDRGEEITLALRCENETIASPDTVLFDQPSRFYFQAIEPTETLSIDHGLLQVLIARNPNLEENRKQVLLKILKESIDQVHSFILYSPEERYEKYVRENPHIINRAPDKYIANILGVTPVSLSRIRKRIATRG